MGRVLGMRCAGDLITRYILRFLVHLTHHNGDTVQQDFYAEMCTTEPDRDDADRLLERFSIAAMRLWDAYYINLKVTQRIEVHQTSKDWIKMLSNLSSVDKDTFTLQDRDRLAGILGEGGFETTEVMIRNLKTIDDFVGFLTRYRQILIYFLIVYDNDPIKATFGIISDDLYQQYKDALFEIEDRFYEVE